MEKTKFLNLKVETVAKQATRIQGELVDLCSTVIKLTETHSVSLNYLVTQTVSIFEKLMYLSEISKADRR